MAVVPGCQEVRGACLEGCLGKTCGGFGGFERSAAALNARKNRWPSCFGLKRPKQGGVALKCCKRCKGPAWRVALERFAGGLEGLEGLEGLRGLRAGKRQP